VLKKKHGFKVVEDACHALGAVYQNSMIGSCAYSDAVVFSFHPVKHITTGEGGAVVTNDPEIYKRALLFRTHGITKDHDDLELQNEGEWYHEMKVLGFNYRLPDIQAALGSSQLKKLPAFLKKRRKIAATYDTAFVDNPWFEVPPTLAQRQHAYHLYVMKLKPEYRQFRKVVFQTLRAKGVGVQVHYLPVYLHPYYRQLGYTKGLCSNAEAFYESIISLPMYPGMTTAQQRQVIKIVKEVCHDHLGR
jgi:dTDP-4-amino-4,6-dideoxygalactose transaminase